MTKTDFGINATLYTLQSNKLTVKVTNFGASLVSIITKDKSEESKDVCLGFDSAKGYKDNTASIGATIGRYANRIEKGKLTINGTTYNLETNNGNNHLHGGSNGFEKQLWSTEKETSDSVTFKYISEDGEANYPGRLEVYVTYTLTDNKLTVNYSAQTDKDTVVNLTNHSYFNLSDRPENTYLRINADYTAEINSELIPTGKLLSVKGTPFDFTEYKKIGQDINADNTQLNYGSGYDHSFALNGKSRDKKLCAEAYSEVSGIKMTVFTDMPAVQLYTANFLDGKETGKGGKPLEYRDGFCLETHFFPNTPNIPTFPSCILKKGDTFKSETDLIFETVQ